MTENDMIALAEETYGTIKNLFEENQWNYGENPEKMMLSCGFKSQDLPINFIIAVNPGIMTVTIMSTLPFKVPEDKMPEMALAVNYTNCIIDSGHFEYDIKSQSIYYLRSDSYDDSPMSSDTIDYMMADSYRKIEDFNDKFFMLSKGMTDFEKFMDSMKGGK